MRQNLSKLREFENELAFLVILYGSYDHDGRAQRMIEMLCKLGTVTLIDISQSACTRESCAQGIERLSIQLPANAGKLQSHFRLIEKAMRARKAKRYNVIVAQNYFTTLTGWIVAKYSKAALVYDAYELIIPEAGKAMGKREYFWYLLEKWVAPRCALIISANNERSKIMAEHYKLSCIPEYMRNIPKISNTMRHAGAVANEVSALSRRDAGEKIILYQGYMSLSRGLGRFIEAAKLFPKHYRFALVGDGPDLAQICSLIKDLEKEGRVSVLGRISNHLLPAITKMADVGVISYSHEGLNNIYCSPNKIFEYSQAGLPIVATDQPPLRKMLEKYCIGALISKKASAVDIARTIVDVAESRESFRKGLEQFVQDHSFEQEESRVSMSISKISGQLVS